MTVHSANPSDFRTEADYELLQRLLSDPIFKIPEHLPAKIMQCVSEVMDLPCSEEHGMDYKTKLAAVNSIIKLQKLNLDAAKMVMPKRNEVTTTNASKLTDEELLDQISKVLPLLQ